jgi:XapX domain-containing protein
MLEIIKATLAGIVCGGVFSILNLPIPAPPVLAGVMGIVGVFLGYIIVNAIR